MNLSEQIILLIISFIANVLSAMAGGGAGLLQLPALIILGLPFGIALATHKVASVALGLGATTCHLKQSSFDFKFASIILMTGLPGVFIGASFILKVPDHIANLSLGILTCSLGIFSAIKKDFGQQLHPKSRHLSGYIRGGMILFLIGILNGSLTSGTGLFVTLWLIYWFGLDYKTAIAYTLVLVGIFWNGVGAMTLGILGSIAWDWLPALLIGSFAGGYIGAKLSIKKDNRLIKRLFELMTISVGIHLIIRGLV
ncbi:MAG: sulfite exporter TauE/SafE family protein [Methylococcales bacterium]|jgi:uncharacterized protein|nr:sulfite exporter TauE/SafE family protein [Methylococcales bacterium]MBT7408094.1 sulfite exporter TauE/SafE family protein [Methylococcales bacterium]